MGNLTIEMRNVDSTVSQSPADFELTDWTISFVFDAAILINGVLLNICLSHFVFYPLSRIIPIPNHSHSLREPSR